MYRFALVMVLSAFSLQPLAFSPPSRLPARSDGATLVYAPAGPASAQNPAFSPDGQTVLFTLFHGGYNVGRAGIYTVPISGGGPSRLLDVAGHQTVNLPGAVWNAVLNRIVFASDLRQTDEVWMIAPDGGSLTRVTHHSTPLHFIEPSFSPDGAWIVFEVDTNPPITGSLWKVHPDGAGLTQLTAGRSGGADDREPSWSPAGDRIVFQRRLLSGPRDVWNLYTMAPDGTGITPITTGQSNTDPSWSPDGQWICYSSDHGGLNAPNVFIVSAGGGSPIRVTNQTTNEDGASSWSPDGHWIVFESHNVARGRSPAAVWKITVPGH